MLQPIYVRNYSMVILEKAAFISASGNLAITLTTRSARLCYLLLYDFDWDSSLSNSKLFPRSINRGR